MEAERSIARRRSSMPSLSMPRRYSRPAPGHYTLIEGAVINLNQVREVIAYLAAVLVALWGVAHVIPTRRVVAGFEPITVDNRRVLVQEWLAEALTMWGVAAVVVVATAVGGAESNLTSWLYRVVAGLLIALAVLTVVTGGRTSVIWFKICPALLGLSAALLIAASLI